MGGEYIKVGDLKVYQLAVELGGLAWGYYERLDWLDKKTMGSQFITAVDSIAANIAEGYGRFHYLDRIKFYYNSRGSLLESKHWIFTLCKRNKISQNEFDAFLKKADEVHYELNKYIKSCYSSKDNS
jgi:four helix bundle protein